MDLPFFLSSHRFSVLGSLSIFLPSIIALARSKRNTLSTFLLNFFLGWTLIGWVVALVWAVRSTTIRLQFVRRQNWPSVPAPAWLDGEAEEELPVASAKG